MRHDCLHSGFPQIDKIGNNAESTIMLRESSQGESSVMRLTLEGRKKPIRGHKKAIINTH